ncbi:MAG: hypothetical protein U9N61_08125, partial [Euryarchaeota archaeon]|nr:hypothetical protein [Euryarchaeota archaeon]
MAYNPNKLGLPQLSFYPQQSGRRGPYKKPVKPESLSWLERMYGDRGDVGGWLYGGNVPQTPTSTLGGFDASSLGRRINELGSSRWQDTVQGKALGGRTVNEPASRISNQVSVGHNYDVWVKAHNAIMDATQNMPVGGDELRKKWLANNPRPAPPQTFPTSDGTSLADPANVITTPPTETAYRKLAELEIMPEYLRDQYAKIAQSGIYGKGG